MHDTADKYKWVTLGTETEFKFPKLVHNGDFLTCILQFNSPTSEFTEVNTHLHCCFVFKNKREKNFWYLSCNWDLDYCHRTCFVRYYLSNLILFILGCLPECILFWCTTPTRDNVITTIWHVSLTAPKVILLQHTSNKQILATFIWAQLITGKWVCSFRRAILHGMLNWN